MAINSFNADNGWRNMLEATRFGIGLEQKAFSDMLRGVEKAAEGYAEKKLYDNIANTVNNGTEEEIEALEANIMRNPEAFNQFQVLSENRRKRSRRQRMREGAAIAQSGNRQAYDAFLAENSNDPELLKVIGSIWDRGQETAIDEYIGNAFQNDNLQDRRNSIEEGFQKYFGNPYYTKAVKEARKMFYFDQNNLIGKDDRTALIQNLEYIYSLPKDDPKRIAGELQFRTMARDQFEMSEAETKEMLKLSEDAGKSNIKLSKMQQIINDLREVPYMGGVFGSAKRSFQNLFGVPKRDSEIFRDVRAIINSEVVKNLPPGAASDPDVLMAKEGFINGFASAESIYSAIRGLMKMYEYEADYKREKANWIAQNHALYKTDPSTGKKITYDQWWAEKTEKEYKERKSREMEAQAIKDAQIQQFMQNNFSQPPVSQTNTNQPVNSNQPFIHFEGEPMPTQIR